jgi:hypothetical protein
MACLFALGVDLLHLSELDGITWRPRGGGQGIRQGVDDLQPTQRATILRWIHPMHAWLLCVHDFLVSCATDWSTLECLWCPGVDPSIAEWGHRPPLKFLNSYSIYAYLMEISLDFTNLYKECPQSVDLPPLLYFLGPMPTRGPSRRMEPWQRQLHSMEWKVNMRASWLCDVASMFHASWLVLAWIDLPTWTITLPCLFYVLARFAWIHPVGHSRSICMVSANYAHSRSVDDLGGKRVNAYASHIRTYITRRRIVGQSSYVQWVCRSVVWA